MDYGSIDVLSISRGRPAADTSHSVAYRTIWAHLRTSGRFLETSSGRPWDVILSSG